MTVTETEIETETENARERERAHDWDRKAKRHNRDREHDMNSLYQIPHEAHLLFGRGFCASMDRHEQKKLVAKNDKDMRDQIHKKDDIEEKPKEVDAQCRKEAAAELYDTFDIRIARHWSEKKLKEMTERDCPKGGAWVVATSRCIYRAFFFSGIKTIFIKVRCQFY